MNNFKLLLWTIACLCGIIILLLSGCSHVHNKEMYQNCYEVCLEKSTVGDRMDCYPHCGKKERIIWWHQ